jgi:hypothetical protein
MRLRRHFLGFDPRIRVLSGAVLVEVLHSARPGRASVSVIHPLRVMLLYPGPRYHLIITWSRAATGHVRVGGSPMEGYPPIAEHGLIGDLQTAALVTTDGSVDWWPWTSRP